MAGTDLDAMRDETYRAVGRYIVEFSRLVYVMRSHVVARLTSDPPMLREFVLGEAYADQIAVVFFGACREMAHLDKPEQDVGTTLRNLVQAESRDRNDLAHGDWWVDLARLGIVEPGVAQVIRIRPMRKGGAIKVIDLTFRDLDGWSDRVIALRNHVAEYGAICLGSPHYQGVRVSDVLVTREGEADGEKKRVVRDGPRASEVPFRAT